MVKTHLTIGFIPEDCESDTVYCGDTDESGTVEAYIEIWESDPMKITDMGENEFTPSTFDFYEEESQLWTEVISRYLGEVSKLGDGLSALDLSRVWAYFRGELDEAFYDLFEDAPDEASFPREEYHVGKFYFRIYDCEVAEDEDEDDEIYDERTVIYK